MAQWQCIGLIKISLMPENLMKSRPLIGRELRMLASHWSKGLSEKFQRGYPYDLQLGLYIGEGTSLEVIKPYHPYVSRGTQIILCMIGIPREMPTPSDNWVSI